MTRTAAHPPSPDLEAMRRTLVAQRDFRREQLAQLDRQRGGRALSSAHREVYVSLAVGARTALQDAQSALWRIEHGRFGRCVRCGDPLDLEVLEALPQTARCLDCQRAALVTDGLSCADAAHRAGIAPGARNTAQGGHARPAVHG